VASFYQVCSSYSVLVGKPDGKTSLGGIRGRWGKIPKWIFKNWDGEGGLFWPRIGAGSGSL
jgi:hypothetical protein